eukprot:snap_masked-scaffold_22-processed-gene-2.37-mRNA-1 protein AED:1.00 eAED:1.00 QI:0/0/0/0/1/1/2/0/525
MLMAKLHENYERKVEFAENRVLLLGSARSGKTSVLGSLLDKPFSRTQRSTPMLDLQNIALIGNFGKWTKFTRNEMNVQRVKSCVPSYNVLSNCFSKKKRKFKFKFERSLVEEISTNSSYFKNKSTWNQFMRLQHTFLQFYDFGGQEIVFNATKLNGKYLEQLKFWLNSLQQNASRSHVLLVGTNWLKATKMFKGSEPAFFQVNKTLKSLHKEYSKKLSLQNYSQNYFFPLENSYSRKAEQVKILQEKIETTVSFRNMGNRTAISLGEVIFMDFVQMEYTHMKYMEYLKLAKSQGFLFFEAKELLRKYIAKSLVVYFGNLEDSSTLQSLVVLSPAWLATAFGTLFHDPELHSFVFKTSKESFSDYRYYIFSGFLSRNLLFDVLKRYSNDEIRFFIQVALQHLILIELPSVAMAGKYFLVPNLAPKSLPNLQVKGLMYSWGKHFSLTRIEGFKHWKFTLFIVKLVQKAIDLGSVEEPLITKSACRVVLSLEAQCTVSLVNSEIHVTLHTLGGCSVKELRQICMSCFM